MAEVPFVDVVTTMLDPSIPLTVNEWDEWGDPRREADFAWMMAYSPYDQPPGPPAPGPTCWSRAPLHDPRVMVYEPAKWVAALRESDPEWSPRCLFRVETGAGAHVGPSGRFARLAYEAEVYAWVLDRSASLLTRESVTDNVVPIMIRTTPFHPRLSELNTQGLYTHWQGHLSALRYTARRRSTSTSRSATRSASSTPLRCSSTASTARTPSGFLAGVLVRDIRQCRPGPGAVHRCGATTAAS